MDVQRNGYFRKALLSHENSHGFAFPGEGFFDEPPGEVDAVVESKRLWIYRNLAEWKDLNASAAVREWVNGETFLYLGRAYRLALISDDGPELQLKGGGFRLQRSVVEGGGPASARQTFERYFTDNRSSLIARYRRARCSMSTATCRCRHSANGTSSRQRAP